MLKKAQAALEFLTTYGWAFLVILIVIGTLAYFGILSPSRLLPNRCTFSSEFQCTNFRIRDTAVVGTLDTLDLRLKNNAGAVVDVTAITLAREDGTAYPVCTTAPANPTGWGVAGVQDLAWSQCNFNDLAAGEKGKIILTIRYRASGAPAAYEQEAKGEIYATILSS